MTVVAVCPLRTVLLSCLCVHCMCAMTYDMGDMWGMQAGPRLFGKLGKLARRTHRRCWQTVSCWHHFILYLCCEFDFCNMLSVLWDMVKTCACGWDHNMVRKCALEQPVRGSSRQGCLSGDACSSVFTQATAHCAQWATKCDMQILKGRRIGQHLNW